MGSLILLAPCFAMLSSGVGSVEEQPSRREIIKAFVYGDVTVYVRLAVARPLRTDFVRVRTRVLKFRCFPANYELSGY